MAKARGQAEVPVTTDPLRSKREAVADAMNAATGTLFYSPGDKDIATLPEPVLDELLNYYGSPLHKTDR
jgi:hypothetical protein